MRTAIERAILLQTTSPTDPVDEEISDQLFGGCFKIVIFFILASSAFVFSLTFVILGIF